MSANVTRSRAALGSLAMHVLPSARSAPGKPPARRIGRAGQRHRNAPHGTGAQPLPQPGYRKLSVKASSPEYGATGTKDHGPGHAALDRQDGIAESFMLGNGMNRQTLT